MNEWASFSENPLALTYSRHEAETMPTVARLQLLFTARWGILGFPDRKRSKLLPPENNEVGSGHFLSLCWWEDQQLSRHCSTSEKHKPPISRLAPASLFLQKGKSDNTLSGPGWWDRGHFWLLQQSSLINDVSRWATMENISALFCPRPEFMSASWNVCNSPSLSWWISRSLKRVTLLFLANINSCDQERSRTGHFTVK